MSVTWKTCFRVCVSAFVLYLCIQYWQNAADLLATLVAAAAPIFLGCAIAYFVNILMTFYEKRFFASAESDAVSSLALKAKRPVCMTLAFATLIAAVALIVWLVVPQLSSCIKLLLAALPGALQDATAWLEGLNILPEDVMAALSAMDWESRIGDVAKGMISGIGNVVGLVSSVVSTVASGVVTVFMALIFAIYLLSGKETLSRQMSLVMRRYMSADVYERTLHVLTVLNTCFRHYIVGQCTEAVILGCLCAAGMLVLQLPYAAMVGALTAFTALIPVVGAYIGAGVGAFMILTVSPVKAVVFLIFIVILQQVEGNLIYPRVVGSSIGLPALWVLAAVVLGGGIFGIGGMLVAVPIAAAAYQLLREDVYAGTPRAKSV